MDHEPDPMRRLTILGQEVPRWRVDELRESGFFRQALCRAPTASYGCPPTTGTRNGWPSRCATGLEVLGSLWVAADGRPLAEDAAAALHTAARAAVPHLSHHQTWGRAAARAREGAVHACWTGAGRRHAPRTEPGSRVGPAGHGDGRGGVLQPGPATPGVPAAAAGGAAEQRVLDVLALQAAAYRPGCVTARSGRRLYVRLPAGEDETDPARALPALARSVPRGVVFAGVGPVTADLSATARVARGRGAGGAGAGGACRATAGRGRRAPRRRRFGELVPEVTALRVLDRIAPLWESLSGPVHAMVEHDRAHGSEYGASVAAYIDAFGDTGTAAGRLNVHPNTLRYRLRRARELFGVDLADPTLRLLADLGLRLARRTQ
ncbi:PucR family transcriptional regulator OS=Streptomyces tendae OX=1932 GN=GUR47_23995 PE=3 SV=1 [Streptomyces tendae]